MASIDITLLLTILLIGVVVSFLSGLLGIGGGIIMAPALFYLLPLLQVGQFDMKTVSGLTITQGLFACLSAALRYGRYRFVSRPLVICMGSTILVSSLVGALLSKFVTEQLLLGIFASLALIAAGLMFMPQTREEREVEADQVTFHKPLAVLIALVIGLLGGMVGQGGSFILIPLMLSLLKLPTRIALGSNLAIVFLSSLAGFLGKYVTHQIPLQPALALIAGAVPGAQLGGYVSCRTKVAFLRHLLALIITLAALRMWYEIF
jgi:uncharacterized membrane protein YfcA